MSRRSDTRVPCRWPAIRLGLARPGCGYPRTQEGPVMSHLRKCAIILLGRLPSRADCLLRPAAFGRLRSPCVTRSGAGHGLDGGPPVEAARRVDTEVPKVRHPCAVPLADHSVCVPPRLGGDSPSREAGAMMAHLRRCAIIWSGRLSSRAGGRLRPGAFSSSRSPCVARMAIAALRRQDG